MKIYKAAIIGLGPSGLAVNKILYGNGFNEIIAFESEDINKRDNFFGFWLTDWMRPFENIIEKKWYKWTIGNKNLDITHTSLDKPYCVISFKTWKKFCLETKNKLEIVNKQVVQYFPEQNYFKIITADNKIYYAQNIIFNLVSKFDSPIIKLWNSFPFRLDASFINDFPSSLLFFKKLIKTLSIFLSKKLWIFT